MVNVMLHRRRVVVAGTAMLLTTLVVLYWTSSSSSWAAARDLLLPEESTRVAEASTGRSLELLLSSRSKVDQQRKLHHQQSMPFSRYGPPRCTMRPDDNDNSRRSQRLQGGANNYHNISCDGVDATTQHHQYHSRVSCTGTRLGRALVLRISTSPMRSADMDRNVDFFAQFGIGANDTTEMLDGVDYVLAHIVPSHLQGLMRVERITECARTKRTNGNNNVRLLWIPNTPCFWCAAMSLIKFLGGLDALVSDYAYVVILDAASRGPFRYRHKAASHWLDVLMMSGWNTWTPDAPLVISVPRLITVPKRSNVGDEGDGVLLSVGGRHRRREEEDALHVLPTSLIGFPSELLPAVYHSLMRRLRRRDNFTNAAKTEEENFRDLPWWDCYAAGALLMKDMLDGAFQPAVAAAATADGAKAASSSSSSPSPASFGIRAGLLRRSNAASGAWIYDMSRRKVLTSSPSRSSSAATTLSTPSDENLDCFERTVNEAKFVATPWVDSRYPLGVDSEDAQLRVKLSQLTQRQWSLAKTTNTTTADDDSGKDEEQQDGRVRLHVFADEHHCPFFAR